MTVGCGNAEAARRAIGLPTEQESFPFLILRQKALKDVQRRERRLAWWAQQMHVGLAEQMPALGVITGRTSSDDVVPGVTAAQMTRNDMVNRQVAGAASAILTGEIVAAQDFAPAKFDLWAGTTDHLPKTDDRWTGKAFVGCVNLAAPVGDQGGFVGQQQPHGARQCAGVNRLKIGVENQNKFGHRLTFENYSMVVAWGQIADWQYSLRRG